MKWGAALLSSCTSRSLSSSQPREMYPLHSHHSYQSDLTISGSCSSNIANGCRLLCCYNSVQLQVYTLHYKLILSSWFKWLAVFQRDIICFKMSEIFQILRLAKKLRGCWRIWKLLVQRKHWHLTMGSVLCYMMLLQWCFERLVLVPLK